MSKNQNVEVTEVVEEQIVTADGNPVEVIEKEGFGKKALKFVKKNGKKIAIGAAGVGLAVGGFILGASKKRSSNADVDGLEFIDLDDPAHYEDVASAEVIADDDVTNE